MTIGTTMVNKQFLNYRKVIATSGSIILQDPVSFVYLSSGKSWNGADDKGWKLKIEQGLDATNAYTQINRKILFSQQGYTRGPVKPTTGYTYMEHRTFGAFTSVDPSWDALKIAENTNLAMHKLFKKLDAKNASVSGMENLGEFMDTIHMLRSPAKSIADYLNKTATKIGDLQRASARAQKALRKQRNKSNKPISAKRLSILVAREANRLKKAVAGSVLEFNFGVAPLLSEIQSAIDAAVEIFPDEGIETISARHTSEVETFTNSGFQPFGNRVFNQEHYDRYIYSVSLIARVKIKPFFSGMSELDQLYSKSGFSMKRLIPTAWELAPLSVFIDMFAKVGNVLTAYATDTSNVLSVQRQVTRRRVRTSVASFSGSTDDLFNYSDYNSYRPGIVVYYQKEYSREKWALSIPTLVFTIPGSKRQLTNLGAFLSILF